ncbi:hypothetical protein [Schlegelella aquatica]
MRCLDPSAIVRWMAATLLLALAPLAAADEGVSDTTLTSSPT